MRLDASRTVRALRKKPKKRLTRPPIQQEPMGAVLAYQRIMARYLEIVRKAFETEVASRIGAIVELNAKEKALTDSQRIDQVGPLIAQLLRATRARIEAVVPDEMLEEALASISQTVEGFNKRQVGRVFKAVLGIDILDTPNSRLAVDKFIQENLSLVKNVSEGFLTQAQSEIFAGLRRGARAEEISEGILGAAEGEEEFAGRFQNAETRAELIARDQINKLNGELSELRQTAAGVTRYIWRTVGDERVRPEHAEREGEIFSWDEPPEGGHPGSEINCRCYAEPVLEDLVS